MKKKRLIILVFLVLVSIVYAQSSLKGDFNNDGKVDFEDFFLFAEAFRKCNEKEKICDVKFDLDFDYDIDVEDFFIFAEGFGKKAEEAKKFNVGENCKEVFPGFNGPVNERVNLVFMSFNYENIDKFLEKVKPLVNPNDEKNSFFAFEPVKSNKNKFNLWYVNKAEQTLYKPTFTSDPSLGDWEDFDKKWKNLVNECKVPGNLNVVINMINSPFRESVFELYPPEKAEKAGLSGTMAMSNRLAGRGVAVFLHEFLHAFGKHGDEYVALTNGWDISYSIHANCDIATSEKACSKWCKGEPSIKVEQLKSQKCSDFDFNTCIIKSDNTPCFYVSGGGGRLGKAKSCINKIDFCTSLKDEISCRDTTNNFYMSSVCRWTTQEHPYYKSRCIPIGDEINIGTQCIGGTGCYAGCSMSGLFRSINLGMLASIDSPLGNYNEKILCDRIKQETGSVGGKCNELFKLFGG